MSDKVEEGARHIVQALRAATEGLNYAAACVNGMQAEIDDIKRRLSLLESRWQWMEDCGFFKHPWSERPDGWDTTQPERCGCSSDKS